MKKVSEEYKKYLENMEKVLNGNNKEKEEDSKKIAEKEFLIVKMKKEKEGFEKRKSPMKTLPLRKPAR